MKLLSLNLWGGRQGQILIDYLKQQAQDTDIFCFQEVFDSSDKVFDCDKARPHLFEELKAALPDFLGFFSPAYEGWVDRKKVDFHIAEGQAVFIRRGIEAPEIGSFYVYGNKDTKIAEDFTNEPKNLQIARLKAETRELVVANAHGMWSPGNKLDTPERLEQSRNIKNVLSQYQLPKILCGDFNLMPETESIKMLGRELTDLIGKYGIENTRNDVSWRQYPGDLNKQHYADFMFASPEIKVKNFEVPYNEVSDHLPMILDFSL